MCCVDVVLYRWGSDADAGCYLLPMVVDWVELDNFEHFYSRLVRVVNERVDNMIYEAVVCAFIDIL